MSSSMRSKRLISVKKCKTKYLKPVNSINKICDMKSTPEFTSFKKFYPYYLQEHKNITCKRLHFFGSSLVLIIVLYVLYSQQFMLLWLLPIIGYGFAWVGHFFFEKNRPATFKYPFYSLWADWVMFKDMLIGKIKW
jgi:hypothetical protein